MTCVVSTDFLARAGPNGLRFRAKVRGTAMVGVVMVAWAAGCTTPLDSIEVILRRHARAVARLPEEQQTQLMPFGQAVVTQDAANLLPDDVLSLETARSIAVRANPDVHAAQARLQSATARIAEARARYFPNLVLTHNSVRTLHTPASRNRLSTALQPTPFVPTDSDTQNIAVTSLLNALRRPLFGMGKPQGNTNPFSEHSTGLTTTWTLFDGFVREAQILVAKHVQRASVHSLMDVQRLIVRAVDEAYFQVQFAEEQVRIARADEAFSREQYEETKKLHAAGRAAQTDVENFHVRVLAAQAKVTAAVGIRETGRVVLAELLGQPDAVLPEALALSPLGEETPEDLAPVEAEPWLGRATASRPDLVQFDELLKGEGEGVRAAKGVFLPIVTASGSWGFDRTSNLAYNDDDQSSAGGVELRWELVEGGRRDALVRIAESNRAEAAARLNRQRLAVQSEVRRAVVDLTNAQEQIRLQRENVAISMENRRIVLAGYLAGKETLTRLNEAQRDVIAADAELASARIQLRRAWSDLRSAAGGDIGETTEPPAPTSAHDGAVR
ncbi:MAG: TolC family protein [Planctomycetota bacterium]